METVNIKTLYEETAKIAELDTYVEKLKSGLSPGCNLTLTGPGPVWLYLRLAHALHGVVTSLHYDSPASGVVKIFDHNPR